VKLTHRMQQQQTARQNAHGWRTRLILESPQQNHVTCDHNPYRVFSSNDYLGLANDPRLKAAFTEGIQQYGVGSGASPMIIGHFNPHHRAETLYAEFLERDRAILFNNGYTANLGVLSALLQHGDTIFQDKLNHASLIDAAILSRATLKRYRHLEMAHLHARLQEANEGATLIASDSIFSMDGDAAPLTQLAELAQQFSSGLLIDDAHGIGIFGEQGRGSVQAAKLTQAQVPLLVCPLGKAFGCFGAIVAGPENYIEHILQFARSYTYSTALPPALAATAIASLQLVKTETNRRQHLMALIHQFHSRAKALGLDFSPSQGPIQVLKVGEAKRTLSLANHLKKKGFLIGAIRPPTVAQGASRLRISLSASHSAEDIEALLTELRRAVDHENG
jgi:8-amino-7-oxononanoate synthase